jgi:hypothetical protein
MSLKYSLMATALALSVVAGPASAQDWKLGVSMVTNPGGGIQVLQVFDGSPAQQIGLEAGNVILTVDGTLWSDPLALRDYILDGRTGVRLVFQHAAGFTEADAQFEVVTADPPVAAAPPPGVTAYTSRRPGVYKASPGATRKAAPMLRIKSVRKRAVADPRLKAGVRTPLKTVARLLSKPAARPAYKPVARPLYKRAPNPLIRR